MVHTEEVDDDIFIDTKFDKLTDEGLDSSRGIMPTKEISYDESEQNMINVLRQSSDESFGIEYVYDHITEETRLNLLAETNDDIIYEDFIDNNPVNYSGEKDPLKNVDLDDKHIGAGEVKFSNDVWHEMKLCDEYESEPFRRILKNITEDGYSDVSVSLQYTMELLEDDEWNKRYPIVYMMMRLLFVTPIITIIYLLSIILALIPFTAISISKFTLSLDNSSNDSSRGSTYKLLDKLPTGLSTITTLVKELFVYQIESLNIAMGYHRNDFLDEYKREKKIVEDEDAKRTPIYNLSESIESLFTGYSDPTDDIKAKKYDNKEYGEALGNIIDEIERKAGIKDNTDNKAYATTFRFIAVGEDEDNVKEKLESIKTDIESTYSPTADKNQGGLEVRLADSREKVKDIIIDFAEKKTARDMNGGMVDDYRFRSAHVRRNDPIIVTPRELASFVHVPSEDMIDSTVVKGDESLGGGVGDEGIFG